MISMAFYCLSILTVFILYYFYKPGGDGNTNSGASNTCAANKPTDVADVCHQIEYQNYRTDLPVYANRVSNVRLKLTSSNLPSSNCSKPAEEQTLSSKLLSLFNKRANKDIQLQLEYKKLNRMDSSYKSLDDLLNDIKRLDLFNGQSPLSSRSSMSHASEKSTGLSSSLNFIVGIDFTASNEWSGRRTFNSQSLHKVVNNASIKQYNPYQRVLAYLGTALHKLSPGGVRIHAYGFGDSVTRDQAVFGFSDVQPDCEELVFFDTFEEVLTKYNEIVRRVTLSGPSSLAPIIHKSIDIVKRKQYADGKWPYHVLFVIVDGNVTTELNETNSIEAALEASLYPIDIVVVGVGDGPFDAMERLADKLILKTKFNNFKFVDYNQIVKGSKTPDMQFALHAFNDLPRHYAAAKHLSYTN